MDQDVGKRLHSFPTQVSADALPTDHQVLLILTKRNSTSLSFPLGPSVFSPGSELGFCLRNTGRQQLPKVGAAWGSIVRNGGDPAASCVRLDVQSRFSAQNYSAVKNPLNAAFLKVVLQLKEVTPLSLCDQRGFCYILCVKSNWVETPPFHPSL